MHIREATAADADAIWALLEPVLRAGETYALPRDITRQDALTYWMAPGTAVFVATDDDGAVLGSYILRTNQRGGGAHVCNCAYVTAAAARGRGVASAMCEHSQEEARRRGYRAMQFNFVVGTNIGAVRLWQRLGFEIVGTLPAAFEHPTHGDVDVHIMYKRL